MKIVLRMLLVLILGYTAYFQAMISGSITRLTHPFTFATLRTDDSWATQKLPYIPGGVTFTYPAGLFANPPQVTIAIENLTLPSSTTIVSHLIEANSAASTTIKVFVGSGLGVSESGPAEVNVHITAIGS